MGIVGKPHDVSHKGEVQMKIKDENFTQSFYSLHCGLDLAAVFAPITSVINNVRVFPEHFSMQNLCPHMSSHNLASC